MTADSAVVPLDLEPISRSIQGFNCCFLTLIQVSQETGKIVWYSHLPKSSPQFIMIYTAKGFIIVGETEIDAFLKFPCFLYNPANVGNFISSSSSFSKPSLDIWKFLVCLMLKSSMQDFKHDCFDQRLNTLCFFKNRTGPLHFLSLYIACLPSSVAIKNL